MPKKKVKKLRDHPAAFRKKHPKKKPGKRPFSLQGAAKKIGARKKKIKKQTK